MSASMFAQSPVHPVRTAPQDPAPLRSAPPAAAAPEPSMDELLASIRRIIAEEDLSAAMTPRRDPAPHEAGYGDNDDIRERAPSPAAAAHAPSRPAPRDLRPPPSSIPENHAPRREAPPRAVASEPAQQAWAAVRPGPAREDQRRTDMPRPDGGAPEPHRERPVPAAHRPQEIARHPSGNDAGRPAEATRSEPPRILRHGGEGADRSRVERRETPAVAAPRKDLLGPDADAALSAAFHALGDLALPQQPRTVEDLMKEILRPMLKEWLDRNLPAVVEDLVRAEIERVSARNRHR